MRLPIDRRESPVRDNNLGARRHIANLASNLDLLALRGLWQPLLQLRERFGPLATAFDLFFAIADAHKTETVVSERERRPARREGAPSRHELEASFLSGTAQ